MSIVLFFNESDPPIPNTWRRPETWHKERGVKAITVCSAGHLGSVLTHTIDDNGVVNPSVVCGVTGCDFHEFVKLNDWPQPDKF